MSNTQKGPGEKGSKFWMQYFVDAKNVGLLNDKIHKEDSSINELVWLSPLESKDYSELRTVDIPTIMPIDIAFWPHQGPWWDAVATFGNDGILLVEAKANRKEILSQCKSTKADNIRLIKSALQATQIALMPEQANDEERMRIWFSKYYQLANRLAFLYHLSKKGKNIRLLLLNFVNDTSHIPTMEDDWHSLYKKVWMEMLSNSNPPANVLNIYLEVPRIER